jgi:hypothetical protein
MLLLEVVIVIVAFVVVVVVVVDVTEADDLVGFPSSAGRCNEAAGRAVVDDDADAVGGSFCLIMTLLL